MHTADALSRSATKLQTSSKVSLVEAHEDMVISALPVTDKFRNQLREETAKDEQLTTLIQYVQQGWPSCKASCKTLISEYWNY